MNGTKVNINVEPNGAMTISNDRTTITIQPDGTVAVSTMDPLQLTGASLAKLDDRRVGSTSPLILELLQRRFEKRSSN